MAKHKFLLLLLLHLWIVNLDQAMAKTKCLNAAALEFETQFQGLKQVSVKNVNLDLESMVNLIQTLTSSLNNLKLSIPKFLSALDEETLPKSMKLLEKTGHTNFYISKQASALSSLDIICQKVKLQGYRPDRDNIISILKKAKEEDIEKIPVFLTTRHGKLYSDDKLLTTIDPAQNPLEEFKNPVFLKLKSTNISDFVIIKSSGLSDVGHVACQSSPENFAVQEPIHKITQQILNDFETLVQPLMQELDHLVTIVNKTYTNVRQIVNSGQSLQIYNPIDIIRTVQDVYVLSNIKDLTSSNNNVLMLEKYVKKLENYFVSCRQKNEYILEILDVEQLKIFANIPNSAFVSNVIKLIPITTTSQSSDYILNAKLLIKTSFLAASYTIYRIVPFGFENKLIVEKFLVESNSTSFVNFENPIYHLNCFKNNTVCDTTTLKSPSKYSILCAEAILKDEKNYNFCRQIDIFSPIVQKITCGLSSEKISIYSPKNEYPFLAYCDRSILKFTLPKGLQFITGNCDLKDGLTQKILMRKNPNRPPLPPQIPLSKSLPGNDTYFIVAIILISILGIILFSGFSILMYCKCGKCRNCCSNCCSKPDNVCDQNFRMSTQNFRSVPTTGCSNLSTLRKSLRDLEERQQFLPQQAANAPGPEMED